ncbi:hypothetical protein BDZ94DRAFT_1277422, partial [Collybia nuda]
MAICTFTIQALFMYFVALFILDAASVYRYIELDGKLATCKSVGLVGHKLESPEDLSLEICWCDR